MDAPSTPAQATSSAKGIAHGKPFAVLVGIGLVSLGVVHIVVAWIGVQLAWGGGGRASEQGALHRLADTPLGPVVLWIVAVGLFALVIWRLALAAWGYSWVSDHRRRMRKGTGSVGTAVVYGVLCFAAIKIATGSGHSSGGSSQESLSAKMMGNTFGVIVLVVVAVVIVGIGITNIRKGIIKGFREDLEGSVSTKLERFGQVGYVAKGAAVVIVGGLFGWSALSHNPGKSGGLDQAFRTVLQQPFGSVLLTLLALGFVCFGIFCFGWARHARKE